MRGRGLLSGNDKPGPRRLALVLLIALNTFFLSGFLFHGATEIWSMTMPCRGKR